MKVELRDIVSSQNVWRRLFDAEPEKARTGFNVALAQKEISGVMKTFLEQRTDLLDRIAIPDPDKEGQYLFCEIDDEDEIVRDEEGEPVTDEQKIEDFNHEMEDLLDEKVEMERHLRIEDLDNLAVKLSGAEIAQVLWLLYEGRKELEK